MVFQGAIVGLIIGGLISFLISFLSPAEATRSPTLSLSMRNVDDNSHDTPRHFGSIYFGPSWCL